MNKPDMFSSLFEKTTKTHELILSEYFNEHTGKEIKIYQQSIFEYMEEKHDEDYLYFFFNIAKDVSPIDHPEIVIAYNPNNKTTKMDNAVIFKEILSKILSYDFCNTYTTNELNIQQNDTIMTVHFFANNEQIFKIIYFNKTMKNILMESET